jgi:hypothetical protein
VSGIKKHPKNDNDILAIDKFVLLLKISMINKTIIIATAETTILSIEQFLKKYNKIKNIDDINIGVKICNLYFFKIVKYS